MNLEILLGAFEDDESGKKAALGNGVVGVGPPPKKSTIGKITGVNMGAVGWV